MVSSPITSWHIDGETICERLYFGAPKSLQIMTAAMTLKKYLLLGRNVMTNLDRMLKSRDIALPTKACLVKAMVFQ